VQQTRAKTVAVKLDRKIPYELDGGERDPVKRFQIEVEPGAIAVRVPSERKA
jgi:diacylglycerol kinase family enzyme